ncbi:hypothetical protein [Moraxella lacunata]
MLLSYFVLYTKYDSRKDCVKCVIWQKVMANVRCQNYLLQYAK